MAGHHHGVRPGRQALAFERERFAKQALDLVALNRATHLARDRQPESRWLGLATREHVEHELASRVRAAVAEHPVEVGAAREPHAPGSGTSARHADHQTVSRLRPLSRRRLSVTRPARVRIRARKPCVRARLRFFGW